jgi:plastocyanin
MRRLLQLATLSLVALLVSAPSAWAQGQEVTVRMEDNFFDQANITVEPGTTVTWVQSGDNAHTATASPTATTLSDTGGPPVSSLLITLAATLTLVVSGVIALALLRRRGAS